MTDANGAETRPQPTSSAPRQDRWSAFLGYAIFFVVACILTGAGYLLWAGLLSPQGPRTATERQLLVLKSVVEKNPSYGEAWADYANALMDAGQLTKAENVISDGLSRTATDTPITVAQGRLLVMREKPDEALKEFDKAVKQAEEVRAKAAAKALTAGVVGTVEPYGVEPIIAASIMKARVQWKKADYAGARTSLDRALAENPSMTDVLTMRGDVQAKLGDKAAAERDYRQALKFVPDYKPALDGLKKLG